MKKETKWFALDLLDADDPAMIAMCDDYKMEGYGRWWKLMEILRLADEYKYNIAEPFAYRVLAVRLMITEDEARQYIADLVNTYHMLQTDDEYIWSDKFIQRMGALEKRKKALSEAGHKGNRIKREIKNARQSQSESEAHANDTGGGREEEDTLTPDNAHNITQHKTTKQNTTTTKQQKSKNEIEAVVVTEGQGTDTKAFGLHTCKQAAMADERRFVYPHITARGITPEQLGHWLDAFNRTLEYRNTEAKSHEDYRTHFANWFKFRNTATEDPLTLSPMPVPAPAAPQQPHLAYLKTPQQAQQEEDQRMRSLLEQLGEDPPPPARKTA